jgi:hypothetical protein
MYPESKCLKELIKGTCLKFLGSDVTAPGLAATVMALPNLPGKMDSSVDNF